MKKLNSSNVEEKIEKEILKKLEKKNAKQEDIEQEKEIEVVTEYILRNSQKTDSDNIKLHYDNFNVIKLQKSAQEKKFFKVDLYNEKFGYYKFQIRNPQHKYNFNLPLTSKISKYLFTNTEVLKNIFSSEFKQKINKFDLTNSEYLNLRIFKYLDNYSDLFLTSSDLMLRQKMMNVYIFHILNHILKRKEEIEINNRIEKLVERYNNKTELNLLKDDLFLNEDEEFLKNYFQPKNLLLTNSFGEIFEEFKVKSQKDNFLDFDLKDQGFTSPRVLILVPNKKHARLIIEEIVSVLRNGQLKGISNKKKFKEEYSETDSLNDCFRLGISIDFFNNKLRLYQPFDSSDIIVASPLGLKLSHQNNESDLSVKNKKVYDFLSSIEILLLDFSEVFLYQNMEHLEEILSFLNKQPKNNQNINSIIRIKENVKEDCLQFLRQNIIVSHFKSLEIEVLVKKYCNNLVGGAYVIEEKYDNLIDVIKTGKKNMLNKEEAEDIPENSDGEDLDVDLKTGIKFEFKMLKVFDAMDIFDYKFNYFTKNLWQILCESFERHTIIFASSTLDFIRLKSFFKKNSVSVTFISEDTDKKDWQRNRLFFEEGRFKFLLYSERAHFFKKINLRFAKNIFFYSLPEDPAIFKELVEMIKPSHYKNSLEKYKIEDKNSLGENYSAVISLVSKMEKYNLEKVVGTKIFDYIIKNNLDNYVC